MEQSVYLIRPEGMPRREEIRARIEAAGLRIVESRIIMFPRNEIPVLYSDMNEEFWEHFPKIMCEEPCEIGIVEEEDAVRRLKEIVGLSPDPAKCAPGTIRAEFGSTTEIHWRFPSGNPCFINIIHAPREDEVEKDLVLARKLIASRA